MSDTTREAPPQDHPVIPPEFWPAACVFCDILRRALAMSQAQEQEQARAAAGQNANVKVCERSIPAPAEEQEARDE